MIRLGPGRTRATLAWLSGAITAFALIGTCLALLRSDILPFRDAWPSAQGSRTPVSQLAPPQPASQPAGASLVRSTADDDRRRARDRPPRPADHRGPAAHRGLRPARRNVRHVRPHGDVRRDARRRQATGGDLGQPGDGLAALQPDARPPPRPPPRPPRRPTSPAPATDVADRRCPPPAAPARPAAAPTPTRPAPTTLPRPRPVPSPSDTPASPVDGDVPAGPPVDSTPTPPTAEPTPADPTPADPTPPAEAPQDNPTPPADATPQPADAAGTTRRRPTPTPRRSPPTPAPAAAARPRRRPRPAPDPAPAPPARRRAAARSVARAAGRRRAAARSGSGAAGRPRPRSRRPRRSRGSLTQVAGSAARSRRARRVVAQQTAATPDHGEPDGPDHEQAQALELSRGEPQRHVVVAADELDQEALEPAITR